MEDSSPRRVTEEEMDEAERLRAKGDLATSLRLAQEMLTRAEDPDPRMRILFNVVTCSALLELPELTNQAMAELDTMPEPEFCRAFANMNRAYAEDQHGRPATALAMLDMILDAGHFEKDDCRIHMYQLCLFKGEALTRLRRPSEALDWLDKAHALYPAERNTRNETERLIFGWVEPNIQVNRANCLMGLDRFEEAFQAASEVLRWTDGDLSTLARQYMAECRVWQGRVPEALDFYSDVKKRLPCRLLEDDRIRQGISNCMSYLEKRRPSGRPS